MMPDKQTTESYVVTWFPSDKPIRHVSKRTFEDAQAYIEENELEGFAPMIERVLTTVIEEREIVWNSTDQSRRVEPQGRR
jgi:hypothetical protein